MECGSRRWVWLPLVAFLLVPLAGCGGDDNPEAFAGSFVGEVSGTEALVAVVAAPATGEDEPRDVQVYVSDGRRLSTSLTGSISDDGFVAKSADGQTEATGELGGDSVTGTVELPGGETVEYEASPPSGSAGLYELTASADGDLSGASAAGLGVRGEIALRKQGGGMLTLADGARFPLQVTRSPAGEMIPLRAGQVRLIVLPSGELGGAGKARAAAGGGGPSFFIRSS